MAEVLDLMSGTSNLTVRTASSISIRSTRRAGIESSVTTRSWVIPNQILGYHHEILDCSSQIDYPQSRLGDAILECQIRWLLQTLTVL